MTSRGYLSTIKDKLVEIVKSADSSLNVITEIKFPLYNAKIFPLASVRIGPSRNVDLNYGNKIPADVGGFGNYTLFSFSIHVFALKSTTDQIQAKPAHELAYKIYKKLATTNPDPTSGLIEIFNLYMRESEPANVKEKLSRVIIEGNILAVRPR